MLSNLALELNSIAIHVVRHARRADAEAGVPPARLSALSVLVFGGERTIGQLANSEMVSMATMSRVVDGLVETGLACRTPHPEDGRSTMVRATVRGRRLMERGRNARAKRLRAVLEGLDHAELEALQQALVGLRRALASRS